MVDRQYDQIIIRNGGAPTSKGCSWGIPNDGCSLYVHGFSYDDNCPVESSSDYHEAIIGTCKEHSSLPLFIPKEIYDVFYTYANGRLWASAHNDSLPEYNKLGLIYKSREYDPKEYLIYKQVNFAYAIMIARYAKQRAKIWIHDFHLFLTPGILLKLRPDLEIGFFSHIPTAKLDAWIRMPEAKEILESLSTCLAIGFNTNAARETLQMIFKHFEMIAPRMYTHSIGVSDIMIQDQEQLLPDVSGIIDYINKIKKKEKKLQVLLAVDRADCSKGHKTRMQAIEYLIDHHGDVVKDMMLVMVCPASRISVSSDYQELFQYLFGNSAIAEQNGVISRLNKKARNLLGIEHDLIVAFSKSIPSEQIEHLRILCDIYLMTSRADGLHLGLPEAMAAKLKSGREDLRAIVSSGAGVAEYFTSEHGVTQYDPNTAHSYVSLANCLQQEVMSSLEYRQKQSELIAKRFKSLGFSMKAWIDRAIDEINKASADRDTTKHLISKLYKEHMFVSSNSYRPIGIVLDIDGVLCVEHPEKVVDNIPFAYDRRDIVTVDMRQGVKTTNIYNLLPGAEAFLAYLDKKGYEVDFFSAGSKERNNSFIDIIYHRVRTKCIGCNNIKTPDFESRVYSGHQRSRVYSDPNGHLKKDLTNTRVGNLALHDALLIDDLPDNVYPGQQKNYFPVAGCFHLVPEDKKEQCPDMFEQPDLVQRILQLYFVTAMLHLTREEFSRSKGKSFTETFAAIKANLLDLRFDYCYYQLGYNILKVYDQNLIMPSLEEFTNSNSKDARLST